MKNKKGIGLNESTQRKDVPMTKEASKVFMSAFVEFISSHHPVHGGWVRPAAGH